MKRLAYFLLVLILIISPSLNSDVIVNLPEAKICAKINNLNDFSDIVLIGVWDGIALLNSNKAFRIESNSCINAKNTCPILLYAMSLEYFKTVDIDEIDFENNKNVKKLNLTIKIVSFDVYKYSAIDIYYNIALYDATTIYLYKSKITYKYRSERPDYVQYFKNDLKPFKQILVEP